MTNAQDRNDSGIAPTPEPTSTDPSPVSVAPGSPAAAEQGCCCSVLANATYRAGVPGVEPLIDPTCTLHLAATAAVPGATSAPAAAPSPVPFSEPAAAMATAPIPVVRSTVQAADAVAA